MALGAKASFYLVFFCLHCLEKQSGTFATCISVLSLASGLKRSYCRHCDLFAVCYATFCKKHVAPCIFRETHAKANAAPGTAVYIHNTYCFFWDSRQRGASSPPLQGVLALRFPSRPSGVFWCFGVRGWVSPFRPRVRLGACCQRTEELFGKLMLVFRIKPQKVKLLAGEQKATEFSGASELSPGGVCLKNEKLQGVDRSLAKFPIQLGYGWETFHIFADSEWDIPT